MINKLPKNIPLNSIVKKCNGVMKEFEKTIKKYNISGQVFLLGKGKREFILENNGLVELVYIFRILKAATDYTPEEIYKIINKEFEVFEETIDHLVSAYARINIVSYDSKEDLYYLLVKKDQKCEWNKIENSKGFSEKEKNIFYEKSLIESTSERYLQNRKTFEKSINKLAFINYIDSM